MTINHPLHYFQTKFMNKTTSIHSEARAIKNEIPPASKSHWAGTRMAKCRPHWNSVSENMNIEIPIVFGDSTYNKRHHELRHLLKSVSTPSIKILIICM